MDSGSHQVRTDSLNCGYLIDEETIYFRDVEVNRCILPIFNLLGRNLNFYTEWRQSSDEELCADPFLAESAKIIALVVTKKQDS